MGERQIDNFQQSTGQKALAEKLLVQLEVMRSLGFLPSVSGLNNFETKALTPEEEASAFELWTANVDKKTDTSNAAIFNSLYQNIVNNPEKLKLLTENPGQIASEIVAQMQIK